MGRGQPGGNKPAGRKNPDRPQRRTPPTNSAENTLHKPAENTPHKPAENTPHKVRGEHSPQSPRRIPPTKDGRNSPNPPTSYPWPSPKVTPLHYVEVVRYTIMTKYHNHDSRGRGRVSFRVRVRVRARVKVMVSVRVSVRVKVRARVSFRVRFNFPVPYSVMYTVLNMICGTPAVRSRYAGIAILFYTPVLSMIGVIPVVCQRFAGGLSAVCWWINCVAIRLTT